MKRTYVPFDAWAMPVDVAVSQLVRVGDIAWSCGQCPLDDKGQVMAPGDLLEQTHIVCDYIEAMLPRADLEITSVAKLVVYFDGTASSDRAEMLSIFRERFGSIPLLVPIAVPHFYYKGLMIEVDVFASAVAKRLVVTELGSDGLTLEAVDGGELTWATVKWDRVAPGFSLFEFLQENHAAWAMNLLACQWIASDSLVHDVNLPLMLPATARQQMLAVGTPGESDAQMCALTFSCHPVHTDLLEDDKETKTTTVLRSAGPFTWAIGMCNDASLELVGQTRRIMRNLDRVLQARQLTFADVTKLTCHYVGGASPDDLHGNLKIRHSYYGSPGPASTGLPISTLRTPDSFVAIDVFAVASS